MTMQAQLQALLVAQQEKAMEEAQKASTKVAKPQVFDGLVGKVLGFVIVCRLYIGMRIRGVAVEGQI